LKKTLLQRVKEIPKTLKSSRLTILVILLWSLLIIGLVIFEYTNFLTANSAIYSWYESHGVLAPPFESWQGFGMTPMDLIAIILLSAVFGALMPDIQSVLFGYFSTVILSIALASAYIGNFIWSNLGWGQYLSLVDNGWSWAFYWGALIVFRAVFPIAIALALLGALVGAFAKAYFNYG
jgi:hypothetical protein